MKIIDAIKVFFENMLLKIYFLLKGTGDSMFRVFNEAIKINSNELVLLVDLYDEKSLKYLGKKLNDGILEIILSNSEKAEHVSGFLNVQHCSNINIKKTIPESAPEILKGDEFGVAVWCEINSHINPMSALNALKSLLGPRALLYVVTIDFDTYYGMNKYIKNVLAKKYTKIFNRDEIKHIAFASGLNINKETICGYLRVFALSKGGY